MASGSTEGKVIKCKAALLEGIDQKFTIETIDVAPPKQYEVRIKLIATGVCHTDQSALMGLYDPPYKLGPVILGHEGAGIVESVGPDVTTVKAGDHVIPLYMAHCGKCPTCVHRPDTNICICGIVGELGNTVMPTDKTTRFSKDGKDIYHFLLTSTFTQYTVVHETLVAKINPKAPLDKVCLLGCGIPTGYGSAIKRAKVKPGTSCVVFGLGGVGLSAVMGCKNAGAKQIIGVDINPDKFELAKKLGCTDVVNPLDHKKPVDQVIHEITGGSGADYALECIGSVKTMNNALESTNKIWGRTVIVGIAKLTQELPLLSLNFLYGRELTGSAFGGYRGRAEIPDLVEDYLKGTIKIDELISHTLPLEKINEAFDIMKAGKCVRIILKLWDD